MVLPPPNEVQRQAPPPGLLEPALLLLVLLLQGRRRSQGRLHSGPSHFSHNGLVAYVFGDFLCLSRLAYILAGILRRWVLGQENGQREVESVGSVCHSWGTARQWHTGLKRRLRDGGQGWLSLSVQKRRLGSKVLGGLDLW